MEKMLIDEELISGARFSYIMDLPARFPGAAAIGGGFPVPVEAVAADIAEPHAEHLFAAIRQFTGCSVKGHPAIGKAPGQIDIGALVIYPGLLPHFRLRVIYAPAFTRVAGLGVLEIFLHGTGAHYFVNGIGTGNGIAGIKVPGAHPEIKLCRFGCGTGLLFVLRQHR